MISSRSGKEGIATAVAAGIDSYLTKPFSPAQLKQKIEAATTASRRAGEQRFTADTQRAPGL